jgi:hypothetical protein
VVTKDKVRQAPLYRVLSDVGIIVERLQHNITAEIGRSPLRATARHHDRLGAAALRS